MLGSDISGEKGNPGESIRRVLSYHRRSKHHLHRYAEGPADLDWANQPNPFRTFDGSSGIDLPLLAEAMTCSYDDLHAPGFATPRRLGLDTVAILFELALGLSAWKEYQGSRWALRCNPSSGNLHPTEGYAVIPALPGLDAGTYHYVSRDHRLERRCTLGAQASWLPPHALLIGLSTIPWREAWKYGIRAFRYCQLDTGHALATVRYAAAALGWSAQLLDAPSDAEVAVLLGLDRQSDFALAHRLDHELPEALLLVGPPPLPQMPRPLPAPSGTWAGSANRLSANHIGWEPIDDVAVATVKPPTDPEETFKPQSLPLPSPGSPVPAAALIRQRRSAVALDGQTSINAVTFYRMLDRLLPRPGVPPWDLLPWRPFVHAFLFVHRVAGLAPGLYLFERDQSVHEMLRAACRPEFLWQRPAGCPDYLPLFLLAEGNVRGQAQTVSCHQEIAGDGAFSLGMVAEFGDVLRSRGAWWYRRLFWEAGVLNDRARLCDG